MEVGLGVLGTALPPARGFIPVFPFKGHAATVLVAWFPSTLKRHGIDSTILSCRYRTSLIYRMPGTEVKYCCARSQVSCLINLRAMLR